MLFYKTNTIKQVVARNYRNNYGIHQSYKTENTIINSKENETRYYKQLLNEYLRPILRMYHMKKEELETYEPAPMYSIEEECSTGDDELS